MFSLVLCLWDRQWHLYIGWCHARRQHISTLALSDSSKGSWRSSPCKRLPNLSSGLRQSTHALANTGYWHNGIHTFSLYTKHFPCCISKHYLYIIWCRCLHVYTPLVAQTNHVWIFGMAFDGFQNGDGCQAGAGRDGRIKTQPRPLSVPTTGHTCRSHCQKSNPSLPMQKKWNRAWFIGALTIPWKISFFSFQPFKTWVFPKIGVPPNHQF